MSTTSNVPARQQNKLQTVKKTNKASANSFRAEIDHAWHLYREQLQRNFELMQIITEMQKAINTSTLFTIQPALVMQPEQPPVPVEEKRDERADLPELKTLSVKHFKRLIQVYQLTDLQTKRVDALQSQLELLYALYQLKESYPEKLYMYMGIPDSSGYRYVRALQHVSLIKYSRGKLVLTKSGELLMTCPLENTEQALELVTKLKEEGAVPNYRDTYELEYWFNTYDQKL